MPNEEQKKLAEKRYLSGEATLRALAEEMRAPYETVKKWSRDGNWAQKRKTGGEKKKRMTKKEKELSRLMEASDDIEEALQMAAQGIKKKLAEDTDGAEITDGKFRAGNLNSIAHAIDRQTKTRILLSSVKPKAESKESGGITVRMEPEVEETAE